MALEGKGFFTWKIPNCEKGDPIAIAVTAKRAGLSHVLVKIADGPIAYNGTWGANEDLVTPVVEAVRAQGIQIWGWHYVYGENPVGEANIAIRRIQQFNVDGYVIDAEKEYKKEGKREAAKRFMGTLRSAVPNTPIALSSYRYPSLHPQLPWKEFLEKCDFNMPQVYWMKAHNPGDQLIRCMREFQALVPFRPVIPTGAACREGGWQPTLDEISEFLQTVKSLNLSAVNFWEWSDARSDILPGAWELIRDFPWSTEPQPKDITDQYIDALNQHDPNKMLALYHPIAVHINAARTVQGHNAIRSWFSTMFNQVLPNAKFTLTGFSGTGSSRHFTWTAAAPRLAVYNGSDTFGLYNEKIIYHYTFFTVSAL